VFPDGRGLIIDMGTVLALRGEADNRDHMFEEVSKTPLPEIVGKYGTYSEQSDIFHFGVLMWDTMAMVNPDVLRAASAAFHSGMENLLRDCLELEPRRRPNSVEEVLKRLDSLLLYLVADPSVVVPFHEACERGHVATVLRLLGQMSRSTNMIDQQNCIGQTPLFLAMENGHALIAHELLRRRARLDIKSHAGKTGLEQAFYHGHRAVVDLVLQRHWGGDDAGLMLSCCSHVAFLDILERLVARVDVNYAHPISKNTGLHIAANLQQIDVIRLLLSAGAKPALQNKDGWTPLHLACRHGDLRSADCLITALKGLQLGEAINAQEKLGRTPYMLAAVSDSLPVMQLLRNAGANTELRDAQGFTASQLAMGRGYESMARGSVSQS
jgi:ankyrin repeat protein